MKAYTIQQAESHINQLKEAGYDEFCPVCFSGIEKTKEGDKYCPNEMCLNDEELE